MKRIAGIVGIALVGLLFAAVPARAEDGWKQAAALEVDGKKEAKEIEVDREVSHFRFKCTEGSVIINTVVVRANGQKDTHKIGKRLEKGEETRFDLSSKTKVDGLRISDDGRGKYTVMFKK